MTAKEKQARPKGRQISRSATDGATAADNVDPAPEAPQTSAEPSTPKEDGWHTYHICGGQLREITALTASVKGRIRSPQAHREMLCTDCGDWYTATVERTYEIAVTDAGG